MSIIREFYKTRNDGVDLYKTFSDENYLIQKVGTDEIYEEVIDVENAPYEYIETNEKIITDELSEIEEKAKAYDILIGEVK